ncbi:MAG TPA: Gfo/Idh/MocA family oxidoreductase [Gemmatales bacterium]|nr:Gfo/Idh/MocA family oxidoreductase [Gemmatales bacterium]HMP58281.1 Gfo/Idh/MocA family oxidoreductase [Gemmatales bacterium]
MHRRTFLARSAALGAAASTPLLAPAGAAPGPRRDDKVRIALVGCGGMGNARLRDVVRLADFEVVALCDPDPRQFERSMTLIKNAQRDTASVKTYEDYRKMYDDLKDLDAVVIGTPDHHHAPATIAACHAGKNGGGLDVLCEKPLSHNIVEGRRMVEAVQRQKRVCQVGTQQRSGKHFQSAVAYVQSGKLGHVYLCRTWITNNTAPAGCGTPPDVASPPAGVNYDLWLGPAPVRRFNPARFHGNFRWFQDYGNGLCNDWGVHLNDIILWAMKVEAPLAVAATGGKFEMQDNSDTPDTLDITYEYPGFIHIYTVRRGRVHGGFGGRGHGMEFVGTKGTLTLDRGGWVVTPAPDSDLEPARSGGSDQDWPHVQNFLACIRSRETPASGIEATHRATSTCHLANISYKTGHKIFWDAANERCYRGYDPVKKQFVHEDTEANAYLFREPRPGWRME